MSFNKAKSLKTASKHVQQGKYQSAIEEYRQIAQADPSDVTTLNTLGDLYVKVGQTSEAIASFLHIAEHYRVSGFYLKAIAMLKKVSKLDAGNIDVALKLAALYAQQKLIVDARHQYLGVAEHYIREGQTAEALEIYQKIADLDPENTAVQLKLAEAYLRENQAEKAYDTFLLAANELRRQSKDADALQTYLRAIKAYPRGQSALAAAVSLHLDRQETREAVELIESLLSERPNDAELLTLLARIHQSSNNLAAAETAIEKVLICAPARYQYAVDLASLYARQGDVTGALRLFDHVIESLYEYREEEKGAQLLREVIGAEPQHLGTLTRLASVYERTHDDHLLIDTLNTLADVAIQKDSKPAAINALKRLLELEPDEIQYRRRLRELDGTNASVTESEPVPTIQIGNSYSDFQSESAAEFSDYSIQVTEDASTGFAADSTVDQWSNWNAVVEEPPRAQDFGSFGDDAVTTNDSGFFGVPEAMEVTEIDATGPNLRDELESVDFYLSQGMLDVARYTLEAVAVKFPEHPEVRAKFTQLSTAENKTDLLVGKPEAEAEPQPITSSSPEPSFDAPISIVPVKTDEPGAGFFGQSDVETGFVITSVPDYKTPQETTETIGFPIIPTLQPSFPTPNVTPAVTTSLPVSFDVQPTTTEMPPAASSATSFDMFAGDEMGDLMDFLDEFKAESEQHKPVEDFETHYNLGLAYKEMEMFDEAIEEFQQAFKSVMADLLHSAYISCCNMLAFCFAQKGLPRLAVVWLKKAMEAPGRSEDVYQALRYDLADAYAAMGEFKNAYDTFAEVYAIDVQYRSVKTRMQEVAAQMK